MQNLALAVHTTMPGQGRPRFCLYQAAEQAPVAQDRIAAAVRRNLKMLETWRLMENRQVGVWIDICYIKQYGTHPINYTITQRFASLRFCAGCRISEDTQP